MSQNITLMGASYSAVPAVTLPRTGGGTATFTDVTDTTASASTVADTRYFYTSSGVRTQGTMPTRSDSDVFQDGTIVVAPYGYYPDGIEYSMQGLIDPSSTTATAADVASGKWFYTAAGVRTQGTASGGGSSKNVQVAQSTSRASSSTYTKLVSLTCSTTGTYDVYWSCYRSSTSGTSGSQLYIGGDASGSANTTFTNHIQNNHRTSVQISKDEEVAVYARSRGSNYYAYVGQLTIVQTA